MDRSRVQRALIDLLKHLYALPNSPENGMSLRMAHRALSYTYAAHEPATLSPSRMEVMPMFTETPRPDPRPGDDDDDEDKNPQPGPTPPQPGPTPPPHG